jgi:hypothetical protein
VVHQTLTNKCNHINNNKRQQTADSRQHIVGTFGVLLHDLVKVQHVLPAELPPVISARGDKGTLCCRTHQGHTNTQPFKHTTYNIKVRTKQKRRKGKKNAHAAHLHPINQSLYLPRVARAKRLHYLGECDKYALSFQEY